MSESISSENEPSRSEEQIWQGFSYPDTDFTKVSNSFFDALSLIESVAELKAILYVMRHTWGFQEYDTYRRIATDEFADGRKLKNRERMDDGTGLSRSSVKMGITKAIEHGFIECETDYRDLARIEKSYRLKMKGTDCEVKEEIKQPAPEGSRERSKQLQAMPYAEYLQTPEWSKKRAKALRFAGYKCQVCNSKENLNVHHRTYERRGHELMGDLTVLCNDCHTTFTYNRELAQ